jgi:predicted RND superfamily exporter protein
MEQKLNLRERLLSRWARWSVENWGKALLIALVITVILGFGLARLRMEMTFYSMLPDRSNQVKDLKEITENFSYASGILVVVDGRSIEDPKIAEKTVRDTIDELTLEYSKDTYDSYISSVIGKVDLSIFKEHALMLTKIDDLERLKRSYKDLNLVPLLKHINNDFEAEYSGNSDKLEDEEAEAVSRFKGLGELLKLIEDAAEGKDISDTKLDEVLDSYMFGDPYIMSNDNRMGLMIVQPTFNMNDINMLQPGVDTIEMVAKKAASDRGINAGLTGIMAVGRDEMVTSGQGLVISSILALILILGLLVLAFRMFSVPLISGIPLVTGILWTLGLSGLIINRLNIMTAMYIVALLGLGIDYAIHLLTGYIQERDGGLDFKSAVETSLIKSGAGIITGALTTAAAFFTLTIAKTGIIKELGVVAGLGIISELAAMIIIIPPLLAYREHRLIKSGKIDHRIFSKVKIKSDAASGIGKLLVKAPFSIAIVMLLIVIFLSFKAGDVGIQDNILKMEAKGLESVHLNDAMVKEFGMAPDGLLIISSNINEVRDLTDKIDKLSSVRSVESPADYYVSDKEYVERGDFLGEFTHELDGNVLAADVNSEGLLDELYRLETNLIEMGDMAYLGNMDRLVKTLGESTGIDYDGVKIKDTSFDRLFTLLEDNPAAGSFPAIEALQSSVYKKMNQKIRTMASRGKITPDMLPSNIRDSLISKDGKSFLISISPTQNPWEGEYRDIFTSQVNSVTDKGTGMILVADQLNIMAQQDGRSASILALIVVFLILLVDFKNIKLTVLTMLPLLGSFITLFGIMALTGIKFDFINIIVVPLLIGIGIDDAVHINHRYLKEGKGKMALVISRTGTALLLTTLTTVFGFASFIPSVMRAMRSTGIVLSLAMAIAFLFSVLFHPAVLIIVTEKFGWNIKPWNDKNDK